MGVCYEKALRPQEFCERLWFGDAERTCLISDKRNIDLFSLFEDRL